MDRDFKVISVIDNKSTTNIIKAKDPLDAFIIYCKNMGYKTPIKSKVFNGITYNEILSNNTILVPLSKTNITTTVINSPIKKQYYHCYERRITSKLVLCNTLYKSDIDELCDNSYTRLCSTLYIVNY